MKIIKIFGEALLILIFVLIAMSAESQTLDGAGASFPYPVYSQWAYKYNNLTRIKINYQSIGSGGGIAQITAKTVDFGASDAPLTKEELDSSGLIQFPMVMGGVTPVVNIKSIKAGELKLTPELLAGIYLGEITKWNDSKIQSINPALSLPNTSITVVNRADGSGTTWIFTNYLDKVSSKWHDIVGMGKAVQWPTGVGGKGNEGVATNVQRINGSIGYVEFAYALQSKLTHVLLKNSEGNFVAPTIDTFQSAAANADWINASGFYLVLTDQPGTDCWPITGASFILIHKEQKDPATAKEMLSFFEWCYKHGADIAKTLQYVPMPSNVIELVEKQWKDTVASNGNPVWK
ncbi:MAG: phosphate ABC transporter substrate-binding protein PstS [Candidatus Latescibacteria bacterium]|nr:phosphate ABC transporter substrate-binding protein PstS [Candidatus Latescibacterota bacterium]